MKTRSRRKKCVVQLLAAELVLLVAQQVLEQCIEVANVGGLVLVFLALGRLLEEAIRSSAMG
jgi:hypothetical protein